MLLKKQNKQEKPNTLNYRNLILNIIFAILRLLISAGLIYVIYIQIEYPVFTRFLESFEWEMVPFVAILVFLAVIAKAFTLRSLIKQEDSSKISMVNLIKYAFVGRFLDGCILTNRSCVSYQRDKLVGSGLNNENALLPSLAENILEKLAVVFLASFAVFMMLGNYFYAFPLWVGLGMYLGYKTIKFLSKSNNGYKNIFDAIQFYKGSKISILQSIVFVLVSQLLLIIAQYSIFVLFGYKIDFIWAIAVFSLSQLFEFIIPSLRGIGVKDTVWILLLVETGLSMELIFASSIIYQLIRLSVNLIGGTIYAVRKFD